MSLVMDVLNIFSIIQLHQRLRNSIVGRRKGEGGRGRERAMCEYHEGEYSCM